MAKRVLTVRLASEGWQDGLRKAARKAASAKAYQGEELVFQTPALFFAKLTERRWDLVRALQGKGAMSMREIARRVGRDVKRVHEDVTALVELGLLERTEGGVECPFHRIHVDLELKAAAA
jgi:predicted transcriptional regulator